MDDSLVIMEGSLLLRFLLLQWMVALSLWKVVFRRDSVTPMEVHLLVVMNIVYIFRFHGIILPSLSLVSRCYFFAIPSKIG